jgi:serine/threonine-protein kinase
VIGRHLSHFRITGELGAGGMGEVYRAEDTTLKREVALKILPAEVTQDADRLARFRREAESLAALNHENIVTIHSVGQEDGLHFLAMELVEGRTLDRRIQEGGLPLDELLEIAVPLAAALAAAHEREIVHRDLKPANVMVTGEGKVKVLDFGLAKLAQQTEPPEKTAAAEDSHDLPTATATAALLQTRKGAVMGTMPYMSPEQIAGQAVGPASDIFSLGVMLYEMATGRRPFRGPTSPELMSGILKDVPPPVTRIRPGLPKALARLIDRCLAKDPAERFAGAAELRDELERLRGAAPRARRAVWLTVATAVLLTIAAVAGWRWIGREPATSGRAPVRLAVLPFETVGAGDSAYVGDGIAEEIVRRLTGLRGMGVVPFTGTLPYKASDKSPRDVGRELGVDYVLAGSLRWSDDGSSVEVAPRLVRIADGGAAWSRSFDTGASDVVQVHADIVAGVARELDVALSGKERERLQKPPTDDPVAYEAYLRGIEVLPDGHAPEEEYQNARRLFEQATALDPEFTLAWVRLSDAERSLYFFGYDRTESRLERAWKAVRRANELDPDVADVHIALGDYHYQGHLDYARALSEYSKAVEDLPNDPQLLRSIAYIWRRQGLIDQAIGNMERATALNPTDSYANIELAYTLTLTGAYDRALEILESTVRIDPTQKWGYLLKALAYWSRGREGDLALARETLSRYPDQRSPYPAWFWIRQELYEGQPEAALTRIQNLSTPVLLLQARVEPREMLAGLVYRSIGDDARARPELESARRHLENEIDELPDDHRLHAALGLTLAALGLEEDAIREGLRAVELYPVTEDALMGPERVYDLACIYTLVGRHDLALDQIAYLLSIPTHFSPAMIRVDPLLAPLRDHPRLASLLDGEDGA